MQHVVQAQALERDGRRGTYNRAGLVWTPVWAEYVVTDEQLAIIKADKWLSVKVLGLTEQATKKHEFASVAEAEADKAEAHARAVRARATELRAEAKAAAEEIAGYSPPTPAPNPTPFQDALRAATPGSGSKPDTLAAMPGVAKASLESDKGKSGHKK